MKKVLFLTMLASLATASQALTLNFEGFAAGTWVKEQYAGSGVHISASNPNGPDKAIIFDSANPTGGDTDLRTPGYHSTNTVPYGKILIIAENDNDSNNDGLVDHPDDEGAQPAGYIRFRFDNVQNAGYADMIDIEETGGTFKFYLNDNLVETIGIPKKGDNSVWRTTWSNFNYDELKVNLAGSGAVGELNVVPEPASMAALAVGVLALIRRRANKSA